MDGRRGPSLGEVKRLQEMQAELQMLRFQVARAGKNLNQLTRLVHSRQVHTLTGQDALLEAVGRSCASTLEALDRVDDSLHRSLKGEALDPPDDGHWTGVSEDDLPW